MLYFVSEYFIINNIFSIPSAFFIDFVAFNIQKISKTTEHINDINKK